MEKLPTLRLGPDSQFSAPWPDGPPEATDAPHLYAGIRASRVFGYLIDAVAIFVLLLVAWGLALVAGLLSLGILWPLMVIGLSLLPLGYHVLQIGGPRSATLGMQIVGIEVRTWTGERPGYLQAAIQTILFYGLNLVTSFMVLLVGLFNERGRCLHDILSGTVTVKATAKPDSPPQ